MTSLIVVIRTGLGSKEEALGAGDSIRPGKIAPVQIKSTIQHSTAYVPPPFPFILLEIYRRRKKLES